MEVLLLLDRSFADDAMDLYVNLAEVLTAYLGGRFWTSNHAGYSVHGGRAIVSLPL